MSRLALSVLIVALFTLSSFAVAVQAAPAAPVPTAIPTPVAGAKGWVVDAAGSGDFQASDSWMWNVVPMSGSEVTAICPRCCSVTMKYA